MRALAQPGVVEEPGMCGSSLRGNREVSGLTCGVLPQVEDETSRFPRKELPHMPGSPTTPDPRGARVVALRRFAFRPVNDVGVRDK